MPRAPNEKINEAQKLYKSGMAMVEIAEKLAVSAGTVRSWKNRYDWDGKKSKNKCSVAKKSNATLQKKNATLQKRKKGAQPGNNNAKGASGNPNPNPLPDMTKHGGYSLVIMDALDEEEQKLIPLISDDAQQLLIEEIQVFTIRERRLMQAINKYRNQKGDVAVSDVYREEQKRSFKDKAEEAEYERQRSANISNGKALPGKSYKLSTHTTNKDMIAARLEQELSSVQSKKTKAIETLYKLQIEKQKLEASAAGNGAVDDWISAVMETEEG